MYGSFYNLSHSDLHLGFYGAVCDLTLYGLTVLV